MNADVISVARLIASAGVGYGLGAIPFGVLLTRAAGLGDLRAIGSGNIGATNVLRTGYRWLALATLVLDGGKGAVAVLACADPFGRGPALAAGAGAMLGHVFPIWLRLRGGKGVATGLGVLLAASGGVGLLACGLWLVVALSFRISSLAALATFAMAPVAAWILAPPSVAVLALFLALLVFRRHAANITRLRAGTEPRIGQ